MLNKTLISLVGLVLCLTRPVTAQQAVRPAGQIDVPAVSAAERIGPLGALGGPLRPQPSPRGYGPPADPLGGLGAKQWYAPALPTGQPSFPRQAPSAPAYGPLRLPTYGIDPGGIPTGANSPARLPDRGSLSPTVNLPAVAAPSTTGNPVREPSPTFGPSPTAAPARADNPFRGSIPTFGPSPTAAPARADNPFRDSSGPSVPTGLAPGSFSDAVYGPFAPGRSYGPFVPVGGVRANPRAPGGPRAVQPAAANMPSAAFGGWTGVRAGRSPGSAPTTGLDTYPGRYRASFGATGGNYGWPVGPFSQPNTFDRYPGGAYRNAWP